MTCKELSHPCHSPSGLRSTTLFIQQCKYTPTRLKLNISPKKPMVIDLLASRKCFPLGRRLSIALIGIPCTTESDRWRPTSVLQGTQVGPLAPISRAVFLRYKIFRPSKSVESLREDDAKLLFEYPIDSFMQAHSPPNKVGTWTSWSGYSARFSLETQPFFWLAEKSDFSGC